VADTGIGQSLTEAQQAEAVAPSSLKGYSAFQRAVNVTLPFQLRKAATLIRQSQSTLSGGGG
jgi:hypothetical protein